MFLSGKIFFIFAALFGGAGLFYLPVFLEDNTDLSKIVRKRILIAACVVLAIVLIIAWVFYDPGRITEEKLAYKVSSYDDYVKFEVVDITKDKEIEPVYTIDCSYGVFKVPESIFYKYIGSNRETLPVHVESATMFVSYSLRDHKFDSSVMYIIRRVSFPWEEKAAAFTNKEVIEFKDLLLQKKNRLDELDFSFAVDQLSVGSYHGNCLKDGAVKIIK